MPLSWYMGKLIFRRIQMIDLTRSAIARVGLLIGWGVRSRKKKIGLGWAT